jgi:hypothetical protein
MIKHILFLLFLPIVMFSQITSSTINGSVKLNDNNLINSKIVLLFVPTNSEYITTTDKHGRFSLDNLDVGGPYTLSIYDDKMVYIKKNIYLILGENDLPDIYIKKL